MKNKTQKIVFAALIAAIYATLTIILAPISYGPLQIRVAEIFTVLPFFSAFSIWGLFVGCLVSNFFSPYGIIDMIFGSLATLIGAIITYYIGRSHIPYKKYLAPLPAVIVNAIVVAFLINCITVTNPVEIRVAFHKIISNPTELSSFIKFTINFNFNDLAFWGTALWVALGEFIACYFLGLPLLLTIEKNKILKKYLS